ncbi:MAG: phosphopantetheine-binding protein [Actinomycetota bacterium]|nr:phosphopantetheine-binding protein [Actinomycetota bacterium]
MSLITVDEVALLIRRELRRKLPEDAVLDESARLEDLGLSSLQVSEIVFTLEEEHEIEFDESRASTVETIGDLVALGNDAIGQQEAGVGEQDAGVGASTP